MTSKLNILFLCTGNSCRSQMAEGWTRHLKDDLINVWSAGIEIHGMNQDAVFVMAEKGIDISNHRSKHIDELKGQNFDYVITVCGHAHETCPLFPYGSKVIHIPFDDPPKMAEQYKSKKEKLDCFREIRDKIKEFVKSLPDRLEN